MFETNASAIITANGTKIGEVTTTGEGELVFTLKTSNADEGQYTIRVTTEELSATLHLELDTQYPSWPRQGNSPLINLPGGLAATPTPTATPEPGSYFIFLPQVLAN